MNETLQTEVLDRLERQIELPDKVTDLVIAAITHEVEDHLGGKPPTKPTPEAAEPKDPVRAYLNATTVEGFRGIGPKAALPLDQRQL